MAPATNNPFQHTSPVQFLPQTPTSTFETVNGILVKDTPAPPPPFSFSVIVLDSSLSFKALFRLDLSGSQERECGGRSDRRIVFNEV